MKNINTIIIFTLLIILTFTMQISAADSQELKPGDVIGYAYHSDIVAYIDGNPIKTYNINGHLAVIAGDLENYGLRVYWDEEYRTTYIYSYSPYIEKNITYKAESVSKDMIGKIAEPVYYTDIKCLFLIFEYDGKEVRSFNVGGHTAIYLADLAAVYADSYVWNSEDRTSNITLIRPWHTDVKNEVYTQHKERPLKLNDGFSFTFKNQSEPDETEFVISESSGSDYYVNSFILSDSYINFNLYYGDYGDYNELGDDYQSELLSDLFRCVNFDIGEGGRRHENTPERKESVSKIFRIYINDELAEGELITHPGNNTTYFYFYFDKLQSLDKIDTIRVEIGYE